MRRFGLVLGALLALAGCLGPATLAPKDGAPAGHELGLVATRTTGILRGVVVDEALRPLGGVEIAVDGPRRASTGSDGNGAFGLDGLPPGTYRVQASKPGYDTVLANALVDAGVAAPPAVKIQLEANPAARPYATVQAVDGFIQCTANVLVVCGAANTVEQQLLCPGLGACTGPVTNDRYIFLLHYPIGAALLQSELVWETTQSLSPGLTLELQALNTAPCPEVDALAGETGGLNASQGTSPVAVRVWADAVAAWGLGGPCGVHHSVFAGESPGLPVGVTVQQRFTLVTHSFHGYLPPSTWTFARDGTAPTPPP